MCVASPDDYVLVASVAITAATEAVRSCRSRHLVVVVALLLRRSTRLLFEDLLTNDDLRLAHGGTEHTLSVVSSTVL